MKDAWSNMKLCPETMAELAENGADAIDSILCLPECLADEGYVLEIVGDNGELAGFTQYFNGNDGACIAGLKIQTAALEQIRAMKPLDMVTCSFLCEDANGREYPAYPFTLKVRKLDPVQCFLPEDMFSFYFLLRGTSSGMEEQYMFMRKFFNRFDTDVVEDLRKTAKTGVTGYSIIEGCIAKGFLVVKAIGQCQDPQDGRRYKITWSINDNGQGVESWVELPLVGNVAAVPYRLDITFDLGDDPQMATFIKRQLGRISTGKAQGKAMLPCAPCGGGMTPEDLVPTTYKGKSLIPYWKAVKGKVPLKTLSKKHPIVTIDMATIHDILCSPNGLVKVIKENGKPARAYLKTIPRDFKSSIGYIVLGGVHFNSRTTPLLRKEAKGCINCIGMGHCPPAKHVVEIYLKLDALHREEPIDTNIDLINEAFKNPARITATTVKIEDKKAGVTYEVKQDAILSAKFNSSKVYVVLRNDEGTVTPRIPLDSIPRELLEGIGCVKVRVKDPHDPLAEAMVRIDSLPRSLSDEGIAVLVDHDESDVPIYATISEIKKALKQPCVSGEYIDLTEHIYASTSVGVQFFLGHLEKLMPFKCIKEFLRDIFSDETSNYDDLKRLMGLP